MKRFFSHISLIALALLLASPAWPKTKKKTAATPHVAFAHQLSHNDSLRYRYFFIEAISQQTAGNHAAAFDLLRHAQSINPGAAETYFKLSLYSSAMNNDTTAVKQLVEAMNLNPDNHYYQEYLVNAYLQMNDYNEAVTALERLSAKNTNNTDYLRTLLRIYQKMGDYKHMLDVLSRLEIVEGSSENITLGKMQVYDQMNDKKAAYNELKKLSTEHPNEPLYRVMLGNWLMQHDKAKEAYKYFQSVLSEEPDNTSALSSMIDYYNATGDEAKAQEQLHALLVSERTPAETKQTLMRTAIQDNEQHGGDSTKIIRLFDDVIKASPKDVDMEMLKAAYMSLKQMPEDSIAAVYNSILDKAPDNYSARLALLQTYWSKREFDKVIAISEQGMEYNPDEMAFYYFSGLAWYQKDDKEKALHAFQQGVRQINSQSNADIVSDFYTMMGDLLHQKGMEQEAFAAYDSALQWKPENVECMNNYAYYLSTKGENLQKAEEMSYKTIKARPNEATFLDTYAWILFQQQRYKEAKIYIDQTLKASRADSVTNDSTPDSLLITAKRLEDDSVKVDSVLTEHAGDIYAMNGLMDEAVSFWQLSIKQGNKSATLPKKIKMRKYIK